MALYGASRFRKRGPAVLPGYVSIAMMLVAAAGFVTLHQGWTEIFPGAFDARSAWDGLAYAWPPERAFAQSTPPTLELTPAGSISDSDGSGLGGARILATFESDGRTYAAVASSIPSNRGVQILDLTDPYGITPVADISYEDSPYLNYAWGDMSVFESDGRTYAALASYHDDRIQILDLTDPYGITPAGSTASLHGADLVDTNSIDTFESGGRTYAAVASDLCIQILDLTDPYGITPAGGIACYDDSPHTGTSSIAVFESDGRTYAAVASIVDDTFQVLDLTDPHNISVVGGITDTDGLYLNGVWDIATFESGGRAYAAVASAAEDGVQILDVTDPHDIVPAGGITDTDGLYLEGAARIDTFESDGRTYGAVAWYNGVQILDLTDPHDIVPAGGIAGHDGVHLDYAWDIAAFESDGRTYAAVTSSYYYNVVQILDLTDPHDIVPADGITADVDIVYLDGASDMSVFESDGRIYGAVASPDDDGVQILDMTDPHNITAADGITVIGDVHRIAVFKSGNGTYAATASYNKGMQILDMTDPHNVTAAGNIADNDGLSLEDVRNVAVFESDGRVYAAVASYDRDGSQLAFEGIQILDMTDPYDVTAAGSIADNDGLKRGGWDIATFESDGRTYAAITSQLDGGIQTLDMTDPHDITVADGDHDDLELEGAVRMATFQSDGRTYAAVAAFADDGVQILDVTDPHNVTAAGSVADTASLELEGARRIAVFESEGRTYAAVGAFFDDGVQILDMTDPHNVTAAGSIADDDSLHLDSIEGIAVFESDDRTYAAITSRLDGGVQILDMTDPHNVTAAGSIAEGSGLNLHRTYEVAAFESEGRTYAAVVALFDNGVHILDMTDPHNVTAAGSITDADIHLRDDSGIAVFESDGRTYAAITSKPDGGVQIFDLTDPHNVSPRDSIADDDSLYLRGADHITMFESDGRTYAAVGSAYDGGIQILDMTDPNSIAAAGGIAHGRVFDHIATFESDGRVYAAASSYGGSVHIFDLTDPYDVTAAGGIAEAAALPLYDADHIATFESEGRTYAAVIDAWHFEYAVQILDLTDPYEMSPAGFSTADGSPTDIAVLELDGRTYAAIALRGGGIHMLDLTDPHKISPAGGGRAAYGGFYAITSITSFELDGGTYLAVTSPNRGVQTLQLAAREPDACVGHAADADAPAIPPNIAASGNRFAVDFYRQISGDGGNVFFSPISVYAAFSMVGEAARGETASQMYDVFGFEPDEGLRHNATAMLMSSLNQQDPCATLQMASSLWLAGWFEPYDSYVGVVGDAYQADIETVDFQAGGVGRINDWAAEKTQGRIPKVLNPDTVPENMTSAILNAIYFKGTWEEPFPVGSTRESDFWTGTREVKADFMSVTTHFGYAESDGVQVLRMPYQGERLSMLVMLPSDRDGLDHLESVATSELIGGWQEGLRHTLVSALVPKFEMSTHYNLTSYLVNMGVEDVFDPWVSDLSGMAHLEPHQRLYVRIATQDAYVQVNEEGTEAAAVTTIGGGMQTSIPPKPVPFIADHPFLFLIQDDESGAILFMGRVSDPS